MSIYPAERKLHDALDSQNIICKTHKVWLVYLILDDTEVQVYVSSLSEGLIPFCISN